MTTEHDVHARHAGIIAPELRRATVFIAGVGMLGGWTTLALARAANIVHVWDHDTVEAPNLGNQAYHHLQLGQPKVEAIADLARGMPVIPHHEKFPMDLAPTYASDLQWSRGDTPFDAPLILISGVDSFAVRKQLAEYALKHEVTLFVDTRAMGEVCVSCIVPPSLLSRYIKELPTDAAAPDAPCGMEGTAYAGMLVTARTVANINAYFRGWSVPYILTEDLRTGMELSIERLRGGDTWTPRVVVEHDPDDTDLVDLDTVPATQVATPA